MNPTDPAAYDWPAETERILRDGIANALDCIRRGVPGARAELLLAAFEAERLLGEVA